jgi:chromosome segregation ATPase
VLRRLLSALGYEPRRAVEPESVWHLKRLAEQLNEKAARFRTAAARAALLEQRIEFLETDSKTWERKAVAVRGRPELVSEVERICGRLEGQLQEARAELATLCADEAHLRNLLTDGRRSFADLVEQARRHGHKVDDCLLYIDLSRPDVPADDTLLADDDRVFVARIIDAAGVH